MDRFWDDGKRDRLKRSVMLQSDGGQTRVMGDGKRCQVTPVGDDICTRVTGHARKIRGIELTQVTEKEYE